MNDDKNADDLFMGEPECNPLDKPYQIAKYRRNRPKQRVYLFDGSHQSAGNLNELLDKGWRLTQQLEPHLGVSSSGQSLYLLEMEAE